MANNRSQLLKKNILFSFVIKGWAGIVQILLVPITIHCLGNYINGIWMVISSVLIWIDSLDIGLGNGLRNKLSERIALRDSRGAKEYVSTTFFTLIGIIIPAIVLILLACTNIDLYKLLNVDPRIIPNLTAVICLSVVLVGNTFIFKFLGNVYLALQLPAVNNALVTLGQTVTLLAVFIQQVFHIHSLTWVAIAYTGGPLLTYLIAYPVTFHWKYKELSPSWRFFKKNKIKELFSLGIKFFVLQIAGIVLFASTNILISRLFSPELVTPYQVTYRYYSFIVMLFTIIAIPFWSATTDAYAKHDVKWIRSSVRKLNLIVLSMLLIIIVMTLVSPFVYNIWVGSGVKTNMMLSSIMGAYIFVIVFSLSYSYILNGIGALNLQLISTVMAALLYLPLAWLFAKRLGINGIALALVIVNIPGAILNRIQYKKIISGKATAFWTK
jgi:O-antigen/teichoic acid export membrane protein